MNDDLKSQIVISKPLLGAKDISPRILTIRGQRVMLDADLADLYMVSTKVFNQAVRRNRDRFPDDFVFRVTEDEFEGLRSQIVTSKRGRGGRPGDGEVPVHPR